MRIGLIIIGDEVLSAKRQDKHLQQANSLLQPRGLKLTWVKIVGDDPSFLTQTLQQSFASGDTVFCFGGIGATPDDRTRQAAAKALGLALEPHSEAIAEIEAQFGEAAYPHRVKMAEYPQGAQIIPNAFNRVPGFSIQNHYFMPGFPVMAKTMMEWVLDHYYATLHTTPTLEKAILIHQGQESEWIEFMQQFEADYPELRLFSLPKIDAQKRRFIEMGVEGLPAAAEQGLQIIINEAKQRQLIWEPLY